MFCKHHQVAFQHIFYLQNLFKLISNSSMKSVSFIGLPLPMLKIFDKFSFLFIEVFPILSKILIIPSTMSSI